MTTTVCDAVRYAGLSAATLSSTSEGAVDLFYATGWLSTAVSEALEFVPEALPDAAPGTVPGTEVVRLPRVA